MRRQFVILTHLTVLLQATALPVSGEYENPYNTSHFRALDLPDAYFPYLSSDGKFLVYYYPADPKTVGIWVAKVDGSDRELIYGNSSIDNTFTGPKFSPDGKKIVFVCTGIAFLEKNGFKWNENATVKFLNVNGSTPSFSPDGSKIVYESTEGEEGMVTYGDVWVMDIDGTNRTRLTFDKDGGSHPCYSPDGTKIVYERWDDRGEKELWIMNSDGSNQKRIGGGANPVFMPDGKIMFEYSKVSPHSSKLGAPSIWMMEQDGSNKTLLVPYLISSVGSMHPSINRNGTRILFEHGIGEGNDLYIVDDPDGDGEWEDSDGDHVADICDGAPNDPNRGYIKDNNDSPGFEAVGMIVVIGGEILFFFSGSKGQKYRARRR